MIGKELARIDLLLAALARNFIKIATKMPRELGLKLVILLLLHGCRHDLVQQWLLDQLLLLVDGVIDAAAAASAYLVVGAQEAV